MPWAEEARESMISCKVCCGGLCSAPSLSRAEGGWRGGEYHALESATVSEA